MTKLPDDVRFLDRVGALVREAGLMREPRFDPAACTLSEGALQLELLNVWHHSRQLTHPETDAILANWLHPPTLGTAAAFGRLDVVQAAISRGAALRGAAGDDPLTLAIGAFCVTPLHVEVVRCLLEAGATVARAHFDTWSAESMGRPLDFELLAMLEAASARQSGRR